MASLLAVIDLQDCVNNPYAWPVSLVRLMEGVLSLCFVGLVIAITICVIYLVSQWIEFLGRDR